MVQTGMGWVAGPRLVTATAEAGGLGILAAATMDLGQLRTSVREVKASTERPFGVNLRADAPDAGERIDMEAGMAKLFASEAAFEIATDALRIHGCNGYSEEYPVERYFRDTPLMIIGEGTSEIQKLVIARKLLERNAVE